MAFYKRVLKRMFVLKRDEMVGGWRRLHNEELHKLYCSQYVIMLIRSTSIRWENTVRIGDTRSACKNLGEDPNLD
jgi:hypothetical protein